MSTSSFSTFEVSKTGLRKLLERRGGKARAITELIQNAWDEDVTTVAVELAPIDGRRGYQRLVVEDDSPDGFTDITHAFTLFAESKKKADASARGRFNLGEKFVIALCESACIATTTGTITFEDNAREHYPRRKRDRGSRFDGVLRMNREEADECAAVFRSLVAPAGICTTFNGEALEPREPVATFEATLPTEYADEEGNLKPTKRKTEVRLYRPREGERASIYELGIPIVELGADDPWHVDIGQKVPLPLDRNNVTPAYLRLLRAEVLNAGADLLEKGDADAKWLDDGMSSDKVSPEALDRALDLRFGEKRVIWDPSDPEANNIAVARGYTVIPSRALNKGVARRARGFDLVKPAGQVTPSPKPYSDDPDAPVRQTLPRDQWTSGMANIAGYAEALADRLMDVTALRVSMVNDPGCRNFSAAYGSQHLEFNVRVLGRAWFEAGANQQVNDLLIHEFGHEYEGNHLSEGYYRALTSLGAKLTELALTEPEFFEPFRR